jgi:cobalt-zinc-cadmium efflux system protein
MIIIATIGLGVQSLAAWVLHGAKGESLNVRGAYLHAFTDAIQSAAIVVVGIVMWATGFWLLDPLVSLLIAGLLFWSGGQILWEASHVLLEGTPRELDLTDLAERIRQVDGVRGVGDLHAWSLTTGYNALSAHVVVDAGLSGPGRDALSRQLTRLLTSSFALQHVTLQVEECCEQCARGDCSGWLRRPGEAREVR